MTSSYSGSTNSIEHKSSPLKTDNESSPLKTDSELSSLKTDSELSPLKDITLNKEVNDIRLSLDLVLSRLLSQQIVISREFEDRIRNVYDSVINDINEVRKHVNIIGERVAAPNKFKTWIPAAPFRKSVLRNAYEQQQPVTKLKGSKSVDFVDLRAIQNDRSYAASCLGRLSSSSSSVNQRSGSRSQLAGYGCCFYGDNKTIPHRSIRVTRDVKRTFRYSWGPSRYGSRSALDDEVSTDLDLDLELGCMCGAVTDDWRVQVAPHMWAGWSMPGLDTRDVEILRERFKKFENFRQEAFAVHNEYRRHHGCPDLLLSHDLSRDAQLWAEKIAIKACVQYSELANRGENILVVDIEHALTGRQAVDTWYREHRLYNYRRPGWQRGTSNFTQLIWRESRSIGVGIAKYPDKDTYVIVAQYQPQGNVNTPSQFMNNVPMPKLRTEAVTMTTDKEDTKTPEVTDTDTEKTASSSARVNSKASKSKSQNETRTDNATKDCSS